MPTSKYRINVTLPSGTQIALARLAKRDQVPTATKAAHLLELALEIEEDTFFGRIAAERDASKGPYLSHDAVWQ